MSGDKSIWAKIDSVFSKVGAFVTGTRLGDRHLLDVAVKESVGIPPGGGGVSSGLTTDVTVNSTTWTALPPGGGLAGRAGFSLQNQTGEQVKLNFGTPAGYVGIIVENQGERFYDANDSAIIYCKSISSTTSGIIIEELKP